MKNIFHVAYWHFKHRLSSEKLMDSVFAVFNTLYAVHQIIYTPVNIFLLVINSSYDVNRHFARHKILYPVQKHQIKLMTLDRRRRKH